MSQAGSTLAPGGGGGGGDVSGPGSSTDNAIARWDGATGTLIQNSGVILDDSNNITGVNDLTVGNDLSVTNDVFVTSGDVAVGVVSATATVHIAGGVTSVGGAPLKIDAGTLTAVPEEGALEFDGSYFYWTDSTPERHSIGDVNGPGSGLPTTDNAIVRWNGTTGDMIQNSLVIIDDSGNVTGIEDLTVNDLTTLSAGVVYAHRSVAVSDNIELTDYFVGVTDNTAGRTLTLPSGAATGQSFTVKDEAGTAGTANAITVDTAGAELIDGAATASINSDYGALRFYFDGTNYFIY